MSINSIITNVDAKTIVVYFKRWEGESFPEIDNNILTINVQISKYTGTIGELEDFKVELHFSTIQVIKLLSDSDPYFLESVTTLNLIEVNYEIMDIVGGGSGQFYTNNFEIQFTNCLLINGSIGNEQLIPVESSSLFIYDENKLYMKMNKCLNINNKNRNKIYTGYIESVNCYYHNTVQLVISGNIPPELAESREVTLYNDHSITVRILSINKPPVSITGLPIPINTSGDNASSINLTGITF